MLFTCKLMTSFFLWIPGHSSTNLPSSSITRSSKQVLTRRLLHSGRFDNRAENCASSFRITNPTNRFRVAIHSWPSRAEHHQPSGWYPGRCPTSHQHKSRESEFLKNFDEEKQQINLFLKYGSCTNAFSDGWGRVTRKLHRVIGRTLVAHETGKKLVVGG